MDTIIIPVTRIIQTKDEVIQFAKDIENYVKKLFKLKKKFERVENVVNSDY